MAAQFHVFGPTVLKWGTASSENTVGQSDGQALITMRIVRPHIPITTDAKGGQPEDWVQAQPHAIVTIRLISWDTTEVRNMEAALAAASTAASPSKATWGEAGQVGKLLIADGGARSLVVEGNKKTAENGGVRYQFPRAFLDPDSQPEQSDIGSRASAKTLVFRCEANADGQYIVPTSIT